MANQVQPSKFRKGQQVKIIICRQQDPRHTGQVGTVAAGQIRSGLLRVYVNNGICQATEVEAVDETPSKAPLKRPYHYEWNSLRFKELDLKIKTNK